jgi:rRNA-processing protein FCF1
LPVSDKKEIVIKDACILFDLVDLNLLEDFFQLEADVFTTSQVIGEITNELQWNAISKFINHGRLQIDDNGTLEEITKINELYPGLSLPDSSVLELAIRKKAIVYSADGSLRKASAKEGITVRGVIWVVAQLHTLQLLTDEAAIAKLNMYEVINQRAPLKEIKNLISKIQNK